MATRTVEVFSAGCGVCDDAVRMVRSIVCESCDLQVHDMRTEAGLAKARRYGISRLPSVVVDGQLAECCQTGGVSEFVLRSLGVGTGT